MCSQKASRHRWGQLTDDLLTSGAALKAVRCLSRGWRACRRGGHLPSLTDAAYPWLDRSGVEISDPSPAADTNLRVFRSGVSRHPFVVYRSSMSPRIAVSTAESGVGTVGRWAPRGRLGCSPRRGGGGG